MENIYLVYYEKKDLPGNTFLNGYSIQCKGVNELITELTELIKLDVQNVNIYTVISNAFMI